MSNVTTAGIDLAKNVFSVHAVDVSRRWGRLGARLTGVLDLNLLRQSLETLLERHEVLRTGIVRNEAGIVQQVNQTPPCIMNPIDLSGMPSELAFAREGARVSALSRCSQSLINAKEHVRQDGSIVAGAKK